MFKRILAASLKLAHLPPSKAALALPLRWSGGRIPGLVAYHFALHSDDGLPLYLLLWTLVWIDQRCVEGRYSKINNEKHTCCFQGAWEVFFVQSINARGPPSLPGSHVECFAKSMFPIPIRQNIIHPSSQTPKNYKPQNQTSKYGNVLYRKDRFMNSLKRTNAYNNSQRRNKNDSTKCYQQKSFPQTTPLPGHVFSRRTFWFDRVCVRQDEAFEKAKTIDAIPAFVANSAQLLGLR